jgi:hypothetical protein
MKSQSIAYLLNGSEHIYWIWDLEGEVHSIWDVWISGLQECKGDDFSEVMQANNNFQSSPKKLISIMGGCPCLNIPPPKSSGGRGKELNIYLFNVANLLFQSA